MASENAPVELQLCKKLSAKTICGTVEKPKKQTDLFTLAGVLSNMEVKETSFGPSVCFIGDFVAKNLATGVLYRAPACYLPGIISDTLKFAYEKAHGEIEFSIMVGVDVDHDKRSGTGYKYTVKTLHEARESETMRKMAQKAGIALPNLAEAPQKQIAGK